MTTTEAEANGVAHSTEEEEAINDLRQWTEKADAIRKEYSECARQRREAILRLRGQNWSYRRIGEVIGVSGQRIDSMRRLAKPE